jgi:hypothetical protein
VLVLALALMLAACNSSSSRGGEPTVARPSSADAAAAIVAPSTEDAMQEPTLPVIRAVTDVAAHFGARVEAHGTYAVLSTGRHKIIHPRRRLDQRYQQVAQLALDGGGATILWVRPDDELATLGGKRVVVIGKLVPPAAEADGVAAPDGGPSLVEISSVAAE